MTALLAAAAGVHIISADTCLCQSSRHTAMPLLRTYWHLAVKLTSCAHLALFDLAGITLYY
jgi:hypothetical protein